MAARRPEHAIDFFVKKLSFPESGCWEWTGYVDPAGYGRFGIRGKNTGYAHIFIYEYLIEDVPSGKEIGHTCRNRRCANPDHLEAVPHRINLLRSPIHLATINAAKTHCPQGHEYTPSNIYRQKGGGRICRTCNLARANARHRARRIAQPSQKAS